MVSVHEEEEKEDEKNNGAQRSSEPQNAHLTVKFAVVV